MNARLDLTHALVGALLGFLILTSPAAADTVVLQYSLVDTAEWPPVATVYEVPWWFEGVEWSTIDLDDWTWILGTGWMYQGDSTDVTVTIDNVHRDDCGWSWSWSYGAPTSYPQPTMSFETEVGTPTPDECEAIQNGWTIGGCSGDEGPPQPAWERLVFHFTCGDVLGILGFSSSGCGPPPNPVETATWGLIKRMYR